MSKENHVKVAIIGAGPAGYTAALYCARADLEPVLFEGMDPGGQLTKAGVVENYPGFYKGAPGMKMMDIFKKQAERFGTTMVPAVVDAVDFSKTPFELTVMGKAITADAVIIATGASARYLGLDSEEAYCYRGVSACATCDGPLYRGKKVVVIGGGDSAMDEAMTLAKFADKVTIIHRRDEFRASKFMQKKTKENPKIETRLSYNVEEVLGDEMGVSGCRIKSAKDGSTEEIPCTGFFLAIGHNPNTGIFKGQIDLDDESFIITKPKSSETNIPGVFAAGDVQDPKYMQAVTSAGTGCMAALDAEHWLLAKE